MGVGVRRERWRLKVTRQRSRMVNDEARRRRSNERCRTGRRRTGAKGLKTGAVVVVTVSVTVDRRC